MPPICEEADAGACPHPGPDRCRRLLAPVTGWALDLDTTGPIGAHVYVDGKYSSATTASAVSSGIPARYAGYGTGHGYATSLQLPEGRHTVCIWGLGASGTPGGNTLLGCTAIVVRHSPFGNLSKVAVRSDGVVVGGWVIDPDTTGGVTARLTVNGRLTNIVGAVLSSSSLGRAYPDFGPQHAYLTLLHLARGSQRVCASADNVSGTPGHSTALGCRTVTVP